MVLICTLKSPKLKPSPGSADVSTGKWPVKRGHQRVITHGVDLSQGDGLRGTWPFGAVVREGFLEAVTLF